MLSKMMHAIGLGPSPTLKYNTIQITITRTYIVLRIIIIIFFIIYFYETKLIYVNIAKDSEETRDQQNIIFLP